MSRLRLKDTQQRYFALVWRFFLPGLVMFGLIAYLPTFYAATVQQTFPKRANYFLSWTVSEQQAKELAQWDLLVLDAEVQERNPESLRLIRQLNPEIIMLAYVTSQDIRQDGASLQTISPLRYKRWSNIPDKWYLKNSSGNKLSWWPGMDLVNASTAAPRHNGQQYVDFLSTHVVDDILVTGHWDGVFYDNTWETITYFAGNDLDIDGDGQRDEQSYINAAWKAGMERLFALTRQKAKKDIFLIGNGDSGFINLNGVMYENFPRNGWRHTLQQYTDFEGKSVKPTTSIVNSNTNNVPNQADYQAFRFGLASALMGDGFYSFDDGDAHHESLWWYDEYEAFLGEAKNEPYRVDQEFRTPLDSEGVWRRDFEHGTVVVNSLVMSKTISLVGEFEHLQGVQDRQANSGRIVDALTIPGRDGRILLRRSEQFFGTAFDNGAFARVFDASGNAKRNGFFAYDSSVRGGNQVLVADLDGNGQEEKIVADNTYVSVYRADGTRIAQFAPYAETYSGGVTIAIGNVTGGKEQEIITGTRNGGGPHVRTFSLDGRLLSGGFFAFHPQFRGGVNVAVGDTDKDGVNEIIVGAGVGGGPHVQIYSSDGRLLSPGFFPYDPHMRGGVRVAAADIDGDGVVEIVTGPGPGVSSKIKVFTNAGELWNTPFFAFDKNDTAGVHVAADDIDGDGRDEIIVLSEHVFTASVIE